MSNVRTSVLASLLLLAGAASIAEAQSARRGDDNRRQVRERDDRRTNRAPARPSQPRDAGDDDDDDDRRATSLGRNSSRTAQSSRNPQPAARRASTRTDQRSLAARPTSRVTSNTTSTPSRAPAAPAALRAPVGQALVLTTNDAQQQIEVVIGPADGQVQVVGINGGSEQNFSNVGSLRLVTGANLDAITFAIRTPVPPQITVETGLGESDVKFVYDVAPSSRNAASDVLVLGGPQNDKVLFEGVALSRSFASNWSARLGDGDNEVVAKMNQPNAAAFTNVWLSAETGAGQDKLEFDVISGAAAQDLRVAGSTGAGNDAAIIKYDGKRSATTAATFGIELGEGRDQGEAIFITRGGTTTLAGEIRGGDGDDTIKLLLEGSGTANATLQGDAGNDYLDMELKGANVRGQTRHVGGTGDDFLKLVVNGPRRISPIMDGGPGIDAAIGFGTIINVEQIDRQ